MKVVTSKDMQTVRGPEDWFTGTVWRDGTPVGDPPDVAVNRVLFEPGARTHWHTHPEGQILYIVTGTCLAAKEGEPPVEVEAGGVLSFALARSTGTAPPQRPIWCTWPSTSPPLPTAARNGWNPSRMRSTPVPDSAAHKARALCAARNKGTAIRQEKADG